MTRTHRGELRWECFCRFKFCVGNVTHRLRSYPLGYSLLVLPVSVVRWSNQKKVSSAATLFGASLFSLSGVINVLIFLIARPQLLLFSEPEVEVGHSSTTGSAIFPHTAQYNHSPQPSGIEDAGEKVISPIDSRPMLDDV